MKKRLSFIICAAFISAFTAIMSAGLASCAKTEYTVTFNAGSGAAVESIRVEEGTKISEPAALSDGEHVLIGWFSGDRKWDFSSDVVTSSLTLTAEWAKGYSENLQYTLYNGYYSVSGYGECKDVNITIAPQYKGYPVTEVDNYAFSGCKNILSVYIPDCVNFIGTYAFDRCSSLETVHISDNVTYTGGYVFSDCSSLKSANIPSELTYLSDGFFYNCASLTSYGVFNKVDTIGNYAFYGCSSLAAVDFGDVVSSLGEYAFGICDSLEKVTLPENIKTIGRSCFRASKGLTSVEINGGEGVTVGDRSFFECVSLEKLSVGGKTSAIGEMSFAYCTMLSEVYFSSSVMSVGNNAFRACDLLSKFTFGGSASLFSSIAWGEGNDCLLSANRFYGG